MACAADSPLAGTEWRLVELGQADGPVTAVADPDMQFSKSEIGGWTGCNFYDARYNVRDSELRLDGLMWTEAGCPSQTLFQQEQQIQDSLVTVERYEMSGDRLTLHSEGGKVLVFRRVVVFKR